VWKPEGCCCISWTVAGLHQVLLFIAWMGQSSSDVRSQEKGLAYPTITGGGKKECTAPTGGRSQQHLAASSSHQTGKNEGFG